MFAIPHFPLLMDVYRMTLPYDFTTKAFAFQTDCQLRNWGAENKALTGGFFHSGINPGAAAVLCPAFTDLQDASCGAGGDLLELPVGSGRWYIVGYVDDVAKGFANEYRFALITKVFGTSSPSILNFPSWPQPIP